MSDRDDVKQPLDHLPPQEEREGDEIDEPTYPDSEGVAGESAVSPDTEAEPEAPNRHGIDKLPPTGR
ncbi:hypothetical protein [Microbacterium cremeum]|uniref:hypothetical protein n=1 Tax=Microbacterium cremeum TaxID=2782169 RepID=UPI0018898A93|nr:hypothetical protein [Microbacterium cremeum]